MLFLSSLASSSDDPCSISSLSPFVLRFLLFIPCFCLPHAMPTNSVLSRPNLLPNAGLSSQDRQQHSFQSRPSTHSTLKGETASLPTAIRSFYCFQFLLKLFIHATRRTPPLECGADPVRFAVKGFHHPGVPSLCAEPWARSQMHLAGPPRHDQRPGGESPHAHDGRNLREL